MLQVLTEITPYIKGIWTAIGPLLGVFVGALLARSWDKKKWMDDNRKEESRELLAALSNSFTTMLDLYGHMRPQSTEDQDKLADAKASFFRTVHDRMFIASDVRELELETTWLQALNNYKENFDVDKLAKVYDTISRDIVRLGTHP
jgi:hypothetical protein